MKKQTTNTSEKPEQIQYIGIDVSKAHLDIYGIPRLARVPNTPQGHKKLLQKLNPTKHQVALEATGGYEDRLIFALHNTGCKVSRFEPSRVRNYAKSLGRKAKNDTIDARTIAEFAQHAKPAALKKPSEDQSALKALCNVRQQLVAHHASIQKQIKQAYHPIAAKQLEKTLKSIAKQIEAIDKEIKKLLEKPEFKQKVEKLMKIKGVGIIGASSTLAFMPEIDTIEETQAAALLGVAPMQNQSGTSEKPRKTQGGRAKLRTIIYMNAICCIRHNSKLKAVYQRLRKSGKPAKIAIVAVMRKLIVLMNRVLRDPRFQLADEPAKAKKQSTQKRRQGTTGK